MFYKVPFVNIPEHYKILKEEILKTIDDVLSRGDLILRKDVEDFEKDIASLVGTKYAVSLNSGTDALFFPLKAAGIGPGDEVITVSHTFVASVAVIVHAGAEPVLIEVGEDFTMDMNKLEEAITPKTKAVIPVHLNGRVCDMKRLMEVAKEHNLAVIEDAAQALGAKFEGKMAGSFGLASAFSLYPFKILGCFGDGGIMTTDNEDIAKKTRLFRDHGQKKTLPPHQKSGSGGKTELTCYGWNSRLDNLQAAILNVKLKYLPQWIKRRREIANLYDQGLSEIRSIKLPPRSDDKHFDIYQNYVIKGEKRNELFEFLKERGVETLIKDPIPLHRHPNLGLSHFHLPYTQKLAEEVISLPVYPELTDQQVQYVMGCVKDFYKSNQ